MLFRRRILYIEIRAYKRQTTDTRGVSVVCFHRSLQPPTVESRLFSWLTSLVLAYFSWRYVEHPFRKRTLPALQSQRAIFSVASVVGAVFIAFGLYGDFENGLQKRLDASAVFYSSFEDDKNPNKACILNENDNIKRIHYLNALSSLLIVI